MKRKLQTIADQLSESDIQEIIRLKKVGDKKAVALRKKRDRLAAEIDRIDQQLANWGSEASEPAPARRPRGRPKAGRTSAAASAEPVKRKVGRPRKIKPGPRINLSASVREVLRKAGEPLKASQVVDGLPGEGIKVKDVADMRKRISVVLASQKKHFEQVERGLYRLKE